MLELITVKDWEKILKKNKKKTLKVKKKVVKSKKKKQKKVAVKKTVKKKIIQKKNKVVKKTKKRTRKKKIFMKYIYNIINKAQFGKKRVIFATSIEEAPVIENNFKDVELKYDKVEMKTQVVFTLYPNNRKREEDLLELESMDDEIPDIGQIFG